MRRRRRRGLVRQLGVMAHTVVLRLIDGTCLQCGAKVDSYRREGRCSYAEPCGCRNGQLA